MSAPLEDAYVALQARIAAALISCELIASESGLLIDPPSAFAPSGDEVVMVTSAALLKIETNSVRRPLGGATPRYAVTREHRLEISAAGPDEAVWKAQLAAAETVLSSLADAAPTLDGTCERLWLTSLEHEDLPPNGGARTFVFTIRVRAGDPLGLTP